MNENVVIVSRHAGLLEWLRLRGIEGHVVTGNATPEDVQGKDVYGILPLWLAAHANSVTEVSMPNLPFEMRGKEYTPEQMDEWGAEMRTFIVFGGKDAEAAKGNGSSGKYYSACHIAGKW